MTDAEIEELVAVRKTITNPGARWSTQRKARQKTFQLETDADMPRMELKLRQNELDEDNFSCVLLCHMADGDKITLRRYNGSNHVHGNSLDPHMPEIVYACHIHQAKQRYIEAGKKSDGFAVETSSYSDFNGALLAMMQDCNIQGYQQSDGPQIELYD